MLRVAVSFALLTLASAVPELASAQPAEEPPPSSSSESPSEAPPEDAPITKLPALKKQVQATYPKAALRDRIEADVQLEFDITAEGTVDNIGVVASSTRAETLSSTTGIDLSVTRSSTIADYGFVKAATTAVSKMEFEPAEASGVPVSVRIPFTYRFTLPPPVTATAATETATAAPRVVNFQGVMRERGTRRRVSGVVVTVFREVEGQQLGFEAVTDDEGVFRFTDLIPGEWKVLAEAEGYFPVRTAEIIVAGQVLETTYFIERGSYNKFDVIVEVERVKKEINRRTLTREEIIKVPGTLGDPVRVVENLPGVARTPGGGGQIIVRGSGPQDTGVFVDGVDVPLIYHFGGLRSVIPAEMVETVDFYPGNFSVRYGRFTGGVFDLHIRKLNNDDGEVHGSLDVSLLDAALYLEVPVAEGLTVAVAGRRSYIDFLLEAAVPDSSGVSLISAPRYYDYQALISYQPTAEHDVRGFFFGSDDVLRLLFENPSDQSAEIQSGNLSFATDFQRGYLEYRYTPSDRFTNRLLVSAGRDKVDGSLGTQFRFVLELEVYQLRNEADWKVTDWLTLSAGLDYQLDVADVDVRAPRPPREGEEVVNNGIEDVIETVVEDFKQLQIAPWIETELKLFDERLRIIPGIRFDYFGQVPEERWSFDPRVVVRYRFIDRWTVKAGVGAVHQPPQPQDLNEDFGNPDLKLQSGIQYSLGLEWLPEDHIRIDVTGFYKDLSNLVSRTSDSEVDDGPVLLANDANGRVFGLEVFLEHKFKNNFRGWLSYTLSRAERQDEPGGDFRLFDFDQTHILTLVASYLLPYNWEIGLRWRLVTGNTNTPFLGGVYDSDRDSYVPIPGDPNSERFPMFHQLDLRIDKKWIFNRWKLSAYLSLVNAYNRENIEGFDYNFDFSDRQNITGLPVLPILGIKGEW